MVAEFGFDPSKRIPYTFNPAPFIANPDSAQQGYVTSEPFAVEKKGGFKPNIFLLADNGFSTYATTIETMQDVIDNHPDWVKCFVDGSAKGWYNYLYGDNTAANELIKKDNPDMTDEQIAFSIKALKDYGIVDSGDTEKLGIGAMTDERMADFYDKMVKAKVVPAGIDIKKAYTLDFVNKGVGPRPEEVSPGAYDGADSRSGRRSRGKQEPGPRRAAASVRRCSSCTRSARRSPTARRRWRMSTLRSGKAISSACSALRAAASRRRCASLRACRRRHRA